MSWRICQSQIITKSNWKRRNATLSGSLLLRDVNTAAVSRGERPFVAWSRGDWRFVRFEEDRKLMDTIFTENLAQARLRSFRTRIASTRRAARAVAARNVVCGRSAPVTREVLAQFLRQL